MLKLFNRKKKDNKGFTLVELVVVIAILAILVGLLAPQYTKYVEKSRKSADATNVENVVTAIKVAASDGEYDLPAGEYTVELTKTGMTVKSNITKNTALQRALEEYMGKKKDNQIAYDENGNGTFSNVGLKSSKWGSTEGTVTPITATATVSDTGAVSVEYAPETFAKYAKN